VPPQYTWLSGGPTTIIYTVCVYLSRYFECTNRL
jgi:hypothetical protein